jgi:hypothetical protein
VLPAFLLRQVIQYPAAEEAAASLGGLSAAAVAPLSSDFTWQQLPSPPANALESAAADTASAAALAALQAVVNNAPPMEGAAGPTPITLQSSLVCC